MAALRIRDSILPWVHFNLTIAILPIALKCFLAVLHEKDALKPLYTSEDFLLVGFVICVATFVDVSDARQRGFLEHKPNAIYFWLILGGGMAFIAYSWFLFNQILDTPVESVKENTTRYAGLWMLACAILSVAIKVKVVKLEFAKSKRRRGSK